MEVLVIVWIPLFPNEDLKEVFQNIKIENVNVETG